MIGIGFLCHAENDNVNEMARQLADGFAELGADYHLVDTREADAGVRLLHLIEGAGGDCFLCCFNNIGLPADRNSPIFEILNRFGIPVFGWYLDHPVINAAEFDLPLGHHIIAQTSPRHLDFLAKFPVHGKRPLMELPHAANVTEPFQWGAGKSVPCLFVGTIGSHPDDQRNRWPDQHGETVAGNLNRMVETYLGTGDGGLEDYVLGGLDDGERERLDWPVLRSYAIVLDRYLRDRLKLLMAQTCLDAGGLVAGPGFAELLSGGRPDQLPGAVPAARLPGLIRQSRAVMISTPEYYQSHERCFMAAAQSAVPVTGAQDYPGQWLDGGTIRLDYRHPEGNRDRLEGILADGDGLRDRAERAYGAVKARHQYHHRAKAILTAAV